MYYIVEKFTCVDCNFIENSIGYLSSIEDRVAFESIHGFAFIEWCDANQTTDKSIWFDANEFCYLVDSKTELPEGLQLITNLENPEGV